MNQKDYKDMVEELCLNEEDRMNGWECDFVSDLAGWEGDYTEKQICLLDEIWERVFRQ